MAKKIIITAVLFFAAYNILLHVVNPSWDPFLTSESVNKDRTEEYLFKPEVGKRVVVGTSLVGRIQTNKIYNLAFAGASPMTGLNIIEKSGKTPEILVVETNFLEKPVSDALGENFLAPWKLQSKKIFPSFRKRNAPISFALGMGRYLATGKRQSSSNFSNKYNKVLKDTLMKNKVEKYQIKHDSEEMEVAVKALKEKLDQFKAKGTKIVFLEMPIEKQLSDLPLIQQRRELIKKWFSAPDYHILPQFDLDKVETGDGIHLLPRVCKKFNTWLNKELALQCSISDCFYGYNEAIRLYTERIYELKK